MKHTPPVSISCHLLLVNHVSALLNVHPITVYKWAKSGRLPCIRLGNGSLRFHPEDIRAYLSERMVGGAA